MHRGALEFDLHCIETTKMLQDIVNIHLHVCVIQSERLHFQFSDYTVDIRS